MPDFRISTDANEFDVALIHRFLSEDSHWAKGVSLERVRKSLQHSFCMAGFLGASQIAFARVVTDYTHFGYVRDVFVLPEHRGNGFAKVLMQKILSHPDLDGITFLLRTASAKGLYLKLGFTKLSNPDEYLRFAPIG